MIFHPRNLGRLCFTILSRWGGSHLMPAKRKGLKSQQAVLVGGKRNKTSSLRMASVTEVLATPVKSENDKKDYRVIKLANGLTALLISDTTYPLDKLDEEEKEILAEEMEEESEDEDEDDDMSSDENEDDEEEGEGSAPSMEATGLKMSAAGLCVHMGSFSDPVDLPGLAHFLEHMVFMGSPRFPDENSFDSFISKHGGFDNASTDTETTVFYFETPRRYFHEGLDRFAQFFIDPLMKQSSMERERKAVDSEFQMALPSDDNRLYQILGSLATPGHPMAKFMWGNQSSLSPAGLSDEEVHTRLHEFRKRHYSAQSMCLAVQGQQTLDTLQEWVEHTFGLVPNNGQERESFGHLTGPFSTPEFPMLYRLVPVKNEYKLDLTWALPPLLLQYRSKPLHYLSWVLGHEGKGSLVSFLRRKVWALSLTAGNAGDGFEFNSTFSMFPISLTLTREGFSNLEKVVQAVFSYLDMMKEKGPNKRIFGEIQKIENLDFAFREEKQPVDNVESLCENMQVYPPERYLDGDDLMFMYNPDVIYECMVALSRKNVNICLRSKEVDADKLNETEPWFGTPFSRETVPLSWIDSTMSDQFRDQFHLPPPNVFIAENTGLCESDPSPSRHPVRLVEDSQGELFYRHDSTFLQPRAYICYFFRSPLALQSPENSCMLDLLIMCLLQHMIEDVYPADLAQLSYSVYSSESGGLVIKVSGLSDKLVDLVSVIVGKLATFQQDPVSEEMFVAVAEQQRKNYYNHTIKAKHLVRDVRLGVLQDVYHAANVKHDLVRQFNLQQVKEFAGQFLGSLYLQGLVQGNMTPDQAKQVDHLIRTKLGCSPLPAGAVTELRCNSIPEGVHRIRLPSLDATDANTLVTNYYQEGPGSLKQHAVLETLAKLVEEPVFDTLRTKEQLGYSVSSCLRNTQGVLGLSVTVNTQATNFSAEHVDVRIENFFKEFTKEHLNEEEVCEAVSALTKQKLRADVTLDEEVSRNWYEVVSKEYLFNRAEREVEILASIKLEEVTACLKALLSGKKLTVQVEGSSSPDSAQQTQQEDLRDTKLVYQQGEGMVGDPQGWKKSLFTHPVIYVVE